MSVTTQQLEQQREAAKELVELRDVAQRLASNADFRRLIHDEYMVKDAARLAGLAGDPILDPQQRADSMQMAIAAGHLRRFLSATIQRGNKGADDILAIESNLDEIRAEEAND